MIPKLSPNGSNAENSPQNGAKKCHKMVPSPRAGLSGHASQQHPAKNPTHVIRWPTLNLPSKDKDVSPLWQNAMMTIKEMAATTYQCPIKSRDKQMQMEPLQQRMRQMKLA